MDFVDYILLWAGVMTLIGWMGVCLWHVVEQIKTWRKS